MDQNDLDERSIDDGSGDRPLHELDDGDDREELRQRYYGLIQELRVLLPGVQVLEAVLLAAPFADRFEELDELGRRGYVVALTAGMLSVIVLMAPAVLHRLGDRRARVARLQLATRLVRAGIALLAVALLTCLFVVVRFVFGNDGGFGVLLLTASTMVVLWIVVPLVIRRRARQEREEDRGEEERDGGHEREPGLRPARVG